MRSACGGAPGNWGGLCYWRGRGHSLTKMQTFAIKVDWNADGPLWYTSLNGNCGLYSSQGLRRLPRNMGKKKKTGYEMHVISNTHWDREWRWPFQKTRMQLVDVMDSLLRILDEHPEYACYHLDSQTVMLEDYLAVRPERRAEVESLVRQRRIWIGPWYTAPDMNVISGESIVRNLLLGHRDAQAFGGVMKVGYTPFSFGHVAQLPQIYAGFGIDNCLFYRGAGRDRAKAEFWWEAPDGTRALTSQFSKRGRYNFYFHVYRPAVDDRSPDTVELRWDEIGLPVRCSDPDYQYEPVYATDHPTRFLRDRIAPGIRALREEDKDEFTTRYFLLMQGCDTTSPNPDEPAIIAEADDSLENDTVLHSSLPEYMDKLRGAVGDLPVLTGEMRVHSKGPGCSMVMADAISARIYLKQENARTQTALEKWAEPVSVAAWCAGHDYPEPYLDMAWRFLLQNQSHDSIAGCGVDEVHEEMMHRFGQARQIADEITRRAISSLAARIDTRDLEPGGSFISVWNSLPYARSEIVTATVDFPAADAPDSFDLLDKKGNRVALQVEGSAPVTASVQLRADWPQVSKVRRFTVRMAAENLPALGYATYKVAPNGRVKRNHGAHMVGGHTMENEFLIVHVNDNGTFDLTLKETGKMYARLNALEDSGECGTPWQRETPERDRVHTTAGCPAAISVEEDGPLLTTVRIDQSPELPVMSDRLRRSDETRPVPVTTRLTLRRGCPWVEVRMTVDNTVRNHRMRVLYPTYLKTDTSCADRPFDVIERSVALPDSSEWAEPVRGTHPLNSWVDLSDGKQGLALIVDGLPEYAVFDDDSRTLALTLLRGMDQVNADYAFPPPVREGLQCLGRAEARFAVYPHAGSWQDAELPCHAARFTTPPRVMQSGTPTAFSQRERDLPRRLSFFELTPSSLVFSGIKRAEDRDTVLVRFYNPGDKAVNGTLECHWPVRDAYAATLGEERGKKLNVKGKHTVEFKVQKKRVFTVEIELK
jgi:mannosylglycerate hydrolase